jgi:PPOX class probable F420-dependent enzyme
MWTFALAVTCVLAVVAVAGAATFPHDVDAALKTSKNLYVATKRKDGSESKRSPIWFMYDGNAVYFTTVPDSFKAKRIAKGSPLLVWVGSERGPHFVGKAEILRDPELAAKMAPVYDQKYWISWAGFFRPRADRVRDGKTVIVKVVPQAD